MKDAIPVLTPDKTLITLKLAGVMPRAYAFIVDVILIIVLTFAIVSGISMLLGMFIPSPGLVLSVAFVLAFLSPFLYFILLEGLWNGRTVGKKINGIRVVMADGTPITWRASVWRNILRLGDIIPVPFLTGLVCIFLSHRYQRPGDMVAHTAVIQDSQFALNFTPSPHKVGIHPLEDRVGSLRGMTMDDYVLIKRLCDRFPFINRSDGERLVLEVWLPFAKRMRIEPIQDVHPVYLMEAVVMKYGRQKQLL